MASKNIAPVRVITKAIELFDKGNRWITGDETDDYGNFCMLGALREANSQLGGNYESEQNAIIKVAECVPGAGKAPSVEFEEDRLDELFSWAEDVIPTFNDAQEDTPVTYEHNFSGDEVPYKHRRPKGYKKVKAVMCAAVKKELGITKKKKKVRKNG